MPGKEETDPGEPFKWNSKYIKEAKLTGNQLYDSSK